MPLQHFGMTRTHPCLTDQSVDIMAIGESKLDDSFPDAKFRISNYRLHRQESDGRGGGIMIYVKDSLPHRILREYTGIVDAIEYISIELSMESRKWNAIYIYKPPKVLAKTFSDFMHSLCETFVADDKLCIFMGNINCNMLVKNELTDNCDIYGLIN